MKSADKSTRDTTPKGPESEAVVLRFHRAAAASPLVPLALNPAQVGP